MRDREDYRAWQLLRGAFAILVFIPYVLVLLLFYRKGIERDEEFYNE
jgi:hypothetical protein